jgi:hypothetical protein
LMTHEIRVANETAPQADAATPVGGNASWWCSEAHAWAVSAVAGV